MCDVAVYSMLEERDTLVAHIRALVNAAQVQLQH